MDISSPIEKELRGQIEMTQLELEELKIIKRDVFAKKGKQDELQREFENKARFLAAGIPKAYWELEWSDFTGDNDAKKFVQKYCERLGDALEHGQGIIFSGSHGTGKTALSTLIGKDAIAKGYTVRYLPVAKILGKILESFNDIELKRNLDTIMERVEVLILDDLGKEYLGVRKQLNPMVQLTFDSMLRERYNRVLTTIISTNLHKATIKNQYGDSMLSILDGSAKYVEIKGPDFRLVRSKEFWESIG